MKKTYYSTTTFLILSINRHVYDGEHRVYVAEGFYPYGKKNPKSSNPLLIYMDLYQPWQDRDKHDKFVLQHRLAVRKGIMEKEKDNTVSPLNARDLRMVADLIRIDFFYPVVYQVKFDVSASGRSGVTVAGSGLAGSSEFLISDLNDSEFELIFNDCYANCFDKLREPRGFFNSKTQAVKELLRWSP
ncbi:hypothetical protein [Halomonas sp. BM-2019]|uniref:hypothetical protein n=1 Tax=Halomonas sp. BM-2019 TaxID=2811227 RepID=UPI001B3C283D|nr:MAG: hypothetical protein J5F18_07540 [Halomonas sp. BM-2019]